LSSQVHLAVLLLAEEVAHHRAEVVLVVVAAVVVAQVGVGKVTISLSPQFSALFSKSNFTKIIKVSPALTYSPHLMKNRAPGYAAQSGLKCSAAATVPKPKNSKTFYP
jgi:hypothetical protein